MFFHRVPCNTGKDWQYIMYYKVYGETIIALLIKTPMKIFSYGASQYGKSSAYTMQFNLPVVAECVLDYRSIWNKAKSQFYEKLTRDSIKGEDNIRMVSNKCRKNVLR